MDKSRTTSQELPESGAFGLHLTPRQDRGSFYDAIHEVLAEHLRTAIHANARRRAG